MPDNSTEHPNSIHQKIQTIRNQKVMLDFDLAMLYEVETKVLNQAVKRNLERFPLDFMFKLTMTEWKSMRSQFVTAANLQLDSRNDLTSVSLWKRNLSAIPFAFTEHGVTMVASILRSKKAVEMNIAIVRAFILLRQMAMQNESLTLKLEQIRKELYLKLAEHDNQLSAIYEVIENLLEDNNAKKKWEDRDRIGYK